MESPVYNIPNDLLFKIFSVNASYQLVEPRYLKPITTTRFSSQVCKQWRHLILGSPSLWGRLLCLNELILGSDDWRNEVLSRTKKAMLTVRVCLRDEFRKAIPLLLKILDKEWPRIQHLEVEVWQIIATGDFDDDRWLSIQRPTENLRSIYLRFRTTRSTKSPPIHNQRPFFWPGPITSIRQHPSHGFPAPSPMALATQRTTPSGTICARHNYGIVVCHAISRRAGDMQLTRRGEYSPPVAEYHPSPTKMSLNEGSPWDLSHAS